MKIIINENQLRKILLETPINEISGGLKKLYNDSKSILETSSSQMKMNFSFLLTWGAALGGMMGPLNEYMKGNHPELSSENISLILTATCVILYSDYKEKYDKLFKKINELGLDNHLDECLNKGLKLKTAFVEFLKSLNVTIHSLTNIMSYAFLIPLLPMLYEISSSGYDPMVANNILKSLMGFGILTVSGNTLKKLLDSILKRFSD